MTDYRMAFKSEFLSFFRKIARLAEPLPDWWIWVPLSVAMGLIYSTGPLMQRYLFALITSDETSIYGSSFQQQPVSLPKLDDWFEAALVWPHPCIGLIVVLLAARSPSIKEVFLRFCLVGFITLIIFDLGYAALGNTISIAGLFESVVANFVGSIGAAAIAVILLELANYGFCSFNWTPWPKRGIAGFLVMLGGTLALCIIFYVTDFFYRPRPANIDLMADAPAHGFVIAKKAPKSAQNIGSENERANRAFSLISQAKESSSLNWRAPKNGRISWLANDEHASYNIELSLFTGCGPTETVRRLPTNNSVFSKLNVRSISLWHDWGAWDTTITAERGHGATEFTGTDASFFTIDPSSDGKGIDLQQMAGDTSQVTYSGGTGSLEVFMISPPAKPDETTQVKPNLHFNVDGTEHVLAVSSSASNASEATADCLAAPTRSAFARKVVDLGTSSLLGVRLRVSPTSKSVTLPNNVATLRGDGGWVTVKDVDPSSLDATGNTRIDMITLSGNLKSATINGEDKALKVGDSYVAIGDNIKGSFVSGLLKVSGSAELLWANSNRANQTKWESLPIEYKGALVTFLVSVLIWICRRVAMLITKAENLEWLEDGI